MARARTIRPRLPRVGVDDLAERDDPLNDAVVTDHEQIADDLSNLFDALRDYDQSSIKGVLYRKPNNGVGKYEWVEDVTPPFNMSAVFAEMKERFGGGDFQLRIFAGGRIRKNIDFSIAKDRAPLVTDKRDGSDMMAMVQLMMAQQSEAARDSRSSADRQMQMMMQSSNQTMQMMLGMMTAITGAAGKPTDMIPLIAAMREGNSSGGMKEMVETMVALRTLTEPAKEAGGFDPDDLVGSAIKLVGPVAGAIGNAVGNMNRNRQAQQAEQMGGEGPSQLALPMPDQPPNPALPGPTGNPVLDLIKPDLLYFYNRGHDPEKAADAVYDVIEAGIAQGIIGDANLNDLVQAFAISPDWIADLAGRGIDFRPNPQWAQSFLDALVAIHIDALAAPDAMQGRDDFGGPLGRSSDARDHGAVGASGLQSDESSEEGG